MRDQPVIQKLVADLMPKAQGIRTNVLAGPDNLRLSVTSIPCATPRRIHRSEPMAMAEETTSIDIRTSWANEHWRLFLSEMPLRTPSLGSSWNPMATILRTAENSATFSPHHVPDTNKPRTVENSPTVSAHDVSATNKPRTAENSATFSAHD